MLHADNVSESIRYKRVRMPRAGFDDGWQVVGEYPMFTGGRLEFSADSELAATGSLEFEGGEAPDARDMVRIVHAFDDGEGSASEQVLGTFVMSVAEVGSDMGKESGSAALRSVLHIAKSKLYPRPYTIGRGCNCVERAREIIEGLGLRVSLSSGTRLLRRDIVMEAGESYLDAANRLLAAGGFAPCQPDPFGGVVMAPLPTGVREPAYVFEEGDSADFEPEVVLKDAAADAPNAVHLIWDDDGFSAWASAINDDPLSASSVQAVGYEVGLFETASDPGDGTVAEAVEAVKAQACERLVSECSGTETLALPHPLVPLRVRDVAKAVYPSSGIEFEGEAYTISMEWDKNQHVRATTVIRRQVSADFRITVRGGLLWQ